jgi:hypothetical protein
MIRVGLKTAARLVVFVVVVTFAVQSAPAQAAQPPVKLKLVERWGKEGSGPKELLFPEAAAGAPNGNVYVADQGNHRVQELTPNGEFVLEFSIEGTARDVAVDPVSGDVYVAEELIGSFQAERVQKFTPVGQFVLEIGKEVNKTTKGNLCTQEEVEKSHVICGPSAAQNTQQPGEHEAFAFNSEGTMIAVGGEHDLLYVAEAGGVQELGAEGKWKGKIPLTGTVGSVAVDDSTSHVFAALPASTTVHDFDVEGKEVASIEVLPRQEGGTIALIRALAVDGSSHLAVEAIEKPTPAPGSESVGFLYDDTTGHLLTEFTIPVVGAGMGFNGSGELFIAADTAGEILRYKPEPVAELNLSESPELPAECKEGPEETKAKEKQGEQSVTFDCVLKGSVNPEGVEGTEVSFRWGRATRQGGNESCPMKSIVPSTPIKVPTGTAPVAVSAPIGEGLRPNQMFCVQLLGNDVNVPPPEELTSLKGLFITPIVAPRVVAAPTASFPTSSSVDMFGELNPENAPTEFFFEYAPVLATGEEPLAKCPEGTRKEACPGVRTTAVEESKLYGKMGTEVEATGLQPATTYELRLAAVNQAGATVCDDPTGACATATFTTAPSPTVEAQTGGFADVTQTGATVTGTVNSGGPTATYAFELGVYAGTATQFGVVASGTVSGATPVLEERSLPGLQPGTEYAYRISIRSGYGEAVGAMATFTTPGLPVVLPPPKPPEILHMPPIPFPEEFHPPKKCKRGYKLNKHHQCVKIKAHKRRSRK